MPQVPVPMYIGIGEYRDRESMRGGRPHPIRSLTLAALISLPDALNKSERTILPHDDLYSDHPENSVSCAPCNLASADSLLRMSLG